MESRSDKVLRFRDRREGGRRLVPRLAHYLGASRTIILGLPRGGVVPAAEIAGALSLPLDVIVSRKIGAPGNPELAIGAVAEGGEAYLDQSTVELTGASDAYVADEIARQRREIDHRRARFREGRSLALPADATVILVDDGVATGATVIAAVRALRQQGIARLVLAVPVAPPDTAERLRAMVDELVVLATPREFWAVGAFYDDFRQVTDDEVAELLARVRGAAAPRTAAAATPKPAGG
jgi:putative phosphoribosyl transferase